MSALDSLGLGGSTPVVNEALEPESVRDGSASTKQAYATALDFESLLVNQLAQQLMANSDLTGGSSGGSSSSSTASGFASLLPGALTDSIMSDGGLGIAESLMGSLDPQSTGVSVTTGGQTAASDGAGVA